MNPKTFFKSEVQVVKETTVGGWECRGLRRRAKMGTLGNNFIARLHCAYDTAACSNNWLRKFPSHSLSPARQKTPNRDTENRRIPSLPNMCSLTLQFFIRVIAGLSRTASKDGGTIRRKNARYDSYLSRQLCNFCNNCRSSII